MNAVFTLACVQCFHAVQVIFTDRGIHNCHYARCPRCGALCKCTATKVGDGHELDMDTCFIDPIVDFCPDGMNVDMIALRQRIGNFWDGNPFYGRSTLEQFDALFKARAEIANIDFASIELRALAGYMCRCSACHR